MSPIVSSIEIHRPPDEVFAYVTDPARFPEWQSDAADGRVEARHGPGVGVRYTTIRRIAGIVPKATTSEITEANPPKSWAAHGTGGPVRESIRYSVENLDDNKRSLLTIELDFEGYGIGRLLVSLIVRPQARKEMPINLRKLKDRLEGGL